MSDTPPLRAIDCFEAPCRCCTCQGKHCLVDHPGHSCAKSNPQTEAEVTIYMCGGKQARICPKTGKEHDMSAMVQFKGGGSVACKDCGITAMSLDLMELP